MTIQPALESCDALVILTSAIPQMKAPPEPGQRPEFVYPEGGTPEQIDYQGQLNQTEIVADIQTRIARFRQRQAKLEPQSDEEI